MTISNPITLDDLKDHLRELISDADYDIDEDSGEIIIFTNLREGLNGDLEEVELFEVEELISDLDEEMESSDE